jgi:predicted small lipoprotein YifL
VQLQKEILVSGRVVTRLAPLVLVLAASLSACGGDGDTDAPATDQSASSSPSDSPSGSPSSSTDEGVAVTVTREGDSFTPNGERVELGIDQALVLTIEADEAGELHVHSTPEQEIAYDAGTSEHEIVVDRPGVVEVESHDPDVVLLQLEVR